MTQPGTGEAAGLAWVREPEPVWDADSIEAIEITYDEALTLEGRAIYYDKAGAMVDMIQSHLLQVMALVTMEPPARIGPVELRDMTTFGREACDVVLIDPACSRLHAVLRDDAFDCLLTGESDFEQLPEVMPRLVSRELPALCHSVAYDSPEVGCSA